MVSLAPNKCQHLAITRKRHVISTNQYFIGDFVIEITDKVRDLGTFISHDLKWSALVSHIKANAYICVLLSHSEIVFYQQHLDFA